MNIIKQDWTFEILPRDVMGVIERAARTCYKSEHKIADGSSEKLIRALIKSGHDSVLEHSSISVRIITDRAVTHELVRHRIGVAYSQESQRYVNYKNVEFVLPEEFTGAKFNADGLIEVLPDEWDLYSVWESACQTAEMKYRKLIDRGCKPQLARTVLPNSTKTEIVVTANIRAWRHIFNLRCSKKAYPQIRYLMLDMLGVFYKLLPALFDDLAEKYNVKEN